MLVKARSQRIRRHPDERGAYAILFALMTVMLLSVAALGTDLGNAISRHTDTQNQADFAALAAGQQYAVEIASAAAGSPVSAAVAAEVASSFNSNQPQDDGRACWRDRNCVSAGQLTDCPPTPTAACLANGEARYVGSNRLQVIAPQARVDFGFANVFGADGTSVNSAATVGAFSVGPRILPMFAVSGCDWGREALIDTGADEDFVPDGLASGDQTGPPKLADLDVTIYNGIGDTVETMVPGEGPFRIWLQGVQWNKTWKIGFFRDNGDAPVTVDVDSIHTRTTAGATAPVPLDTNGIAYEFDVPPEVLDHEEVWWIRAWGGKNTVTDADNKWSRVAPSGTDGGARPVTVGESVLECASESDAGNFGTLSIPRTDAWDTSANQIPANIALGLDDAISLRKHPHPTANGGMCMDGDIYDSHKSWSNPHGQFSKPTNCVGSDTGELTNSDALAGFITWGSSGNGGLLSNKATKSGCGPNGGGFRNIDPSGPAEYNINDDRLSCFLLEGKHLGDVDSADYSGGPAFSADMVNSPRFAWVPVLTGSPEGGTSALPGQPGYSIIDFRPAFITDESATESASSDNGIEFDHGDNIARISVFFFNLDALPREGDFELIDFLGVGVPIPHLVD
jgi:hypothetical protein